MKFVKYTSIGLIIGFGGYACYRLIVKQGLVRHDKLTVSSHADPKSLKDSSTSTTPPVTTSPPTSTIKQNNSSSIITQAEAEAAATALYTEKDVIEQVFSSSSSSLPLHTPEIFSLQSSDSEQSPPKTTELKEQKNNEESKVELIVSQEVEGLPTSKVEEETNGESKIPLKLIADNYDLKSQDTTLNSENDLSGSSTIKKNSPKEVSLLSTDSPSTTNCSLDVCPSTPCSSPLDVSEFDGELTTGLIDCSNQRSFSMTSQSSMLGEGMVAKLEQLLQEVGDLKESVGEINDDFVTVRKLEPQLLKITADSISLGDETNGDSMILNGKDECSQTPSLEWDSNGINLLSDLDSNHSTIKEEDESLLSESLLSEKSELFSPISSGSLNSSAEPSLFISFGDTTNGDQSDKEMSSLQFSTSDANENFV